MKKTKTKAELNDTFNYFVNIFNENNIPLIIFYGTLLGYTRNYDLIDGDDDIDVLVNKENYQQIIEIIQKNNFTVSVRNKSIIQLIYDNVPFDIYFYKIFDDNFYIDWDGGLNFKNELIFPLQQVEFLNKIVYVPNKKEVVCGLVYGEKWRIPLNKNQYNWHHETCVKLEKNKNF